MLMHCFIRYLYGAVFICYTMHVKIIVTMILYRLNCLSGYSQTKWVSEKLVMNAISDGFIKGNISR